VRVRDTAIEVGNHEQKPATLGRETKGRRKAKKKGGRDGTPRRHMEGPKLEPARDKGSGEVKKGEVTTGASHANVSRLAVKL